MTDKENIDLDDSTVEDNVEEIQEDSVEEAAGPKVDAPDDDDSANSVFKDKKGSGTTKAANAAPRAKSRSAKGGTAKDSTKQDAMPKTKAGLLNAMYTSASKMGKADLQAAYTRMNAHESTEEEYSEEIREIETKADFSDDLNALIADEATLSEGFKEKAAVIFEAAIRSKLSEEIDRIEDQYKTELDEELTNTKGELIEKVDNYLNYVVENWMKDNKLAIHNGLRTEIAEGFMNNLRDLFEDSYIDVPESKVDLVDGLSDQVAELEEQLNKQTEQSMEQANELETLKRDQVIRENSGDLAETEVEKLRVLADDVDFTDSETFDKKVKTIKESYFKKKSTNSVEDDSNIEDGNPVVATTGTMSTYLDAIRKTKDKN